MKDILQPIRPTIFYKTGYKYQLQKTIDIATDIYPAHDIDTAYIALTKSGLLTVKTGYAWDGPSGPTIDTPNFMRGSLIHDALYQLMRDGHISVDYRLYADTLLYDCIREDGMSWSRAQWVYWAVRLFGGPSADPAYAHPVVTAP